MIIKEADDQSEDLAFLTQITKRNDLTPATVGRVKSEIRNIEAGLRAEKQAAYQLKVYYGSSTNWMVINDLRIEHEGLVAQIDHLLINRFLQFWLCETKSFSSGVLINEHGEFMRDYNGELTGMASPIEQNKAHLRIFNSLLSSGLIKVPKRLGLTIKRELDSLVLVSERAKITRPKAGFKGLDSVIKVDQLQTTIGNAMEKTSPSELWKVIGSRTLEEFARQIAAFHKPAKTSWLAKFGIDEVPAEKVAYHTQSANAGAADLPLKPTKVDKEAQTCAACGVNVSSGVIAYCHGNGIRFGWAIFCMVCQQGIPDTAARAPARNRDNRQG